MDHSSRLFPRFIRMLAVVVAVGFSTGYVWWAQGRGEEPDEEVFDAEVLSNPQSLGTVFSAGAGPVDSGQSGLSSSVGATAFDAPKGGIDRFRFEVLPSDTASPVARSADGTTESEAVQTPSGEAAGAEVPAVEPAP